MAVVKTILTSVAATAWMASAPLQARMAFVGNPLVHGRSSTRSSKAKPQNYRLSADCSLSFYQAQQELDLGAFRKAVLTKIPRYMLPSEYHREDSLRQNGSGKIDRSYYNKLINEPK